MKKGKCIIEYFDIEIGTQIEYVIREDKHYDIFKNKYLHSDYLGSSEFYYFFIDLYTYRYNKLKEIYDC